MNKSQKMKVVGLLYAEITEAFDRIDHLEADNKNGFEHTVARERLYGQLKMRDLLKQCKPFRNWDFTNLDKMVGERIQPNGKLKYGWFGYI